MKSELDKVNLPGETEPRPACSCWNEKSNWLRGGFDVVDAEGLPGAVPTEEDTLDCLRRVEDIAKDALLVLACARTRAAASSSSPGSGLTLRFLLVAEVVPARVERELVVLPGVTVGSPPSWTTSSLSRVFSALRALFSFLRTSEIC